MKIWCLKCGNIIDEVNSCREKQKRCHCCGEKIIYSVNENFAHIALLNKTNETINKEIVVQNFYGEVC